MMFQNIFSQLVTGKNWQFSLLATLCLLVAHPLSDRVHAEPDPTVPELGALPVPNAPSKSISNSQSVPTETDYTLGSGDRLYVSIFQEEDYSGEYLVLVDGTISLPLAGNLKVEGMTLEQVTEQVAQRYARYLRLPTVTVSLLAPRPLMIAVSGEVNHPGAYTVELEDNQQFPTVVDIVKRAGGITTAADVRQVQIRRLLQGEERVLTVDLWDLFEQGDLTDNVSLRDGDTIIVPTTDNIDIAQTRQLADANFGIQTNEPIDVAIIGEVYRPGSYQVSLERQPAGDDAAEIPGNGNLELPTLTQAIEIAGGIKPLADIRNIEIRRTTRTGSQQKIQVNLWKLLQEGNLDQDAILQEGDTIFIPTAQEIDPTEANSLASASFAPDTIQVNVVGEVKEPGLVELPPNTPLNQALLAAGGFDEQRARESSVEFIRLNPNGTVSKREIKIDFSAGINDENNPALRNNDVVIVKRSGVTTVSDGLGAILKPIGNILFPLNILGIFD